MKDVSFKGWMAEFEKALEAQTGMTSDMLPDWDFWSAWNSDMEIDEALEEFLEWVKTF